MFCEEGETISELCPMTGSRVITVELSGSDTTFLDTSLLDDERV
jgi:hypothetical protein